MTRRRFRPGRSEEGGFILLWFAAAIILLLGIAAVVVDVMQGYSQAQHAQNAADAASLAGVVFMPGQLPQAEVLAEEIGLDNMPGANVDVHAGNACTPACLPNQLQVEVEKRYDTFFANVFGIKTVSVKRASTAEFDPPVKLGSPDNTFGNAPGSGGTQPLFWAAVAGPNSVKGGGNAALSEYCDTPTDALDPGGSWVAGTTSPSDNCPSSHVSDDHEDAQFFVIDNPTGSPLNLDLYDPAWVNTQGGAQALGCGHDALAAVSAIMGNPPNLAPSVLGVNNDYCAGDQIVRFKNASVYNQAAIPANPARPPEYCDIAPPCLVASPAPWAALTPVKPQTGAPMIGRLREYMMQNAGLSNNTTFTLYRPDLTPLNPYDNAVQACPPVTYNGYENAWLAYQADVLNHTDNVMSWFHNWTTMCNAGGFTGPYTLKVTTASGTQGENSFSISAYTPSGSRFSDPSVTITAADRLGVYTSNSQPATVSPAEFYLARVQPSSVPRTLRVTLFDTGDFSCPTGAGSTCPGTTSVQIKIKPEGPLGVQTHVGQGGPVLSQLDDCTYTPPGAYVSGKIAPWRAGATAWGTLQNTAAACTIPGVKRADYNGHYVTVDIPIPDSSGYFCDAADPRACWLKIEYTANDPNLAVTDFSSWSANFGGNPVRIVR